MSIQRPVSSDRKKITCQWSLTRLSPLSRTNHPSGSDIVGVGCASDTPPSRSVNANTVAGQLHLRGHPYDESFHTALGMALTVAVSRLASTADQPDQTSLNRHKRDVEHERGIYRNRGVLRRPLPIGQFWRYDQSALTPHPHSRDSLVETCNHLPGPKGKAEPIARLGLKRHAFPFRLACTIEPACVGNRDRVSSNGLGARANVEVRDGERCAVRNPSLEIH